MSATVLPDRYVITCFPMQVPQRTEGRYLIMEEHRRQLPQGETNALHSLLDEICDGGNHEQGAFGDCHIS